MGGLYKGIDGRPVTWRGWARISAVHLATVGQAGTGLGAGKTTLKR